MRNLFFIIIFSCLSLSSFSQEIQVPKAAVTETQPKNEFGMNLFSIIGVREIPHYYHVDVWNPYYDINYNPFSGIYYKRYFNKSALRVSFDYFQKSVSQSIRTLQSNGYAFIDEYSGIKKDVQIKVGYQREFGNKRLSPFVFVDAIFNYGQYSGTSEYNGESVFIYTAGGLFNYENFQYGGAFGAGLKYRIHKHFVLTYEFSYSITYSRIQGTQGADYIKYQTAFFKFNPIRQLGFAFVF